METQQLKTELYFMIRDLNRAIEVSSLCSDATPEERKKDYTLEWAYGVGYSRSSMRDAVKRLEDIVSNL